MLAGLMIAALVGGVVTAMLFGITQHGFLGALIPHFPDRRHCRVLLTRFGLAEIVQTHPAPELVPAGNTAGSPALPTVLIFGFGAPATQSPGALAIGRCAVGGG